MLQLKFYVKKLGTVYNAVNIPELREIIKPNLDEIIKRILNQWIPLIIYVDKGLFEKLHKRGIWFKDEDGECIYIFYGDPMDTRPVIKIYQEKERENVF